MYLLWREIKFVYIDLVQKIFDAWENFSTANLCRNPYTLTANQKVGSFKAFTTVHYGMIP